MKFKIIGKNYGSLSIKKVRIEVEPGKGLIFSRLVSRLLVFFNDNLLTLNLLPPTSKIIWDCMSLKMSSKRGFLLSTKKSSSEDDKWRDSSSSLFLFSWTSFFLPSELLGVGLGNLIWSISVGNFFKQYSLYMSSAFSPSTIDFKSKHCDRKSFLHGECSSPFFLNFLLHLTHCQENPECCSNTCRFILYLDSDCRSQVLQKNVVICKIQIN